MTDVIKNYVGSFFTNILYNRLSAYFLLGQKHSIEKDKQAKKYIDKFPPHIPLVIISSKKDELVPHHSSLRLAQSVAANRILLKEENPEAKIAPVYFLQLDCVEHNEYTTNKSIDNSVINILLMPFIGNII